MAQSSRGDLSPKNGSSREGAKDLKFEVLSIRTVKRGPGMQVAVTNPTPNGFTATVTMWQLVAFAYGPPAPAFKSQVWQRTEMRNQPGWVDSPDVYAIDGRVSQADLKAWQNQNANQDLLHSALRAALKDRFKLALHEEPAQRTMYAIVIAKRGPRLKPAAPGADLPVGMKLESGGVATGRGPRGADGWNFYGATIQDLADLMANIFVDGPVRDRTGLTGRYDFWVPRVETPGENHGFTYSVDQLGLELKRGTENRPILVLDHVERPTPN
jgi:uncharacterized protein (TIGR03435 family)